MIVSADQYSIEYTQKRAIRYHHLIISSMGHPPATLFPGE